MTGTPSRLRLALERWWCGLRGHHPQLAFRRASVAMRCGSCGHESCGITEGRDPRPPAKPVVVAPPPLPATPVTATVQLWAGTPPTGGAQLRVLNVIDQDGRLSTVQVQMSTEELIEFSVGAFLAAGQATGQTHAEIAARCLSRATGIRPDLSQAIASEAIGRVVLLSMRPATTA